MKLLDEHTRYYRNDSRAATALLDGASGVAPGCHADAAGWTGVARTIMNLEEFVTRE